MNHLKISTRLAILIGGLSILLLMVGVLGLYSTSASNNTLKTVYDDRVLALGQLEGVSRIYQRNRILVMDMMLNPEVAHIEKQDTELRANVESANKLWAAYKETYLTPEEAKLAEEFEKNRETYVQEALLPTRDAMRAGKLDEALKVYKEKLSPLSPLALDVMDKLVQLQLDVAKTEYDGAVARFSILRNFAIASIVGGILFALLFGVALMRSILRQLGGEPSEVLAVTSAITDGNLNTQISVAPGHEHSVMAGMVKMQESLSRVVSTVRQGSEGLATASAEIAQGNNDLSARTEQQASALEETAASMEQLSATVNQNADSARQANQLAMSASSVAVQGGVVVSQVVQTMKGINDASRKIADIISVIDGIAFQTNILALNAAVEAARAGEQGRGFAVVASEVRSLAGRSAEAAKEIKALIGASVERVDHGTALVDQAGTTMTEVVDSIKRVTDLMGEISAASSEQAAGVSQIGEAVTQMDQVTQQNAALVEEMAAAASSLKGQAQELVEVVSIFNLGSQDGTPKRPSQSTLSAFQRPAAPRLAAKVPPKSATPRPALAKPATAQFKGTAAARAPGAGDDDWETF
jgi:methyl-accepting chemotaxis protein